MNDDVFKFLKQIIDEFINNDPDERNKLIGMFEGMSKRSDLCKSYPEISHIVYDLNDSNFTKLEKFFDIKNSSKNDFDYQALTDEAKIFSQDNIDHFERHIRLCCYQREYMDSAINDAKDAKSNANESLKKSEKAQKRFNSIKKRVKKAAKISKEASKRSKNTMKKSKRIYSEFVGILAIFTAMSFAMMGSVQILGNLFNDIENSSNGTIGYALVIGGIYIIVMYMLIITLLVGIKKLYGFYGKSSKNKYHFSKGLVLAIFGVSLGMILGGLFVLWKFK